jgi:hypothetical protein
LIDATPETKRLLGPKKRLESIGKTPPNPAVYIHQHRLTPVVEVVKPQNEVMVPVVTLTAKVLVPGKKQPVPDPMLRAPVQSAHSS